MSFGRTVRTRSLLTKRQFFPRWNRISAWRIRHIAKNGNTHGKCDKKRKLIVVYREVENLDELDRLLIHEISHAVSRRGHGQQWQRRLEKAAETAEQLGRNTLAQLLREEVHSYRNSPNTRLEYDVEDSLMNNLHLTRDAVILWIADYLDVSIAEASTIFKRRIETVYQEAQRLYGSHDALTCAGISTTSGVPLDSI